MATLMFVDDSYNDVNGDNDADVGVGNADGADYNVEGYFKVSSHFPLCIRTSQYFIRDIYSKVFFSLPICTHTPLFMQSISNFCINA